MVFNLRLATTDDAAAVAAIYRPIVKSTPISFEIEPPDDQEMQKRIRETLTSYPWLVCEAEGHVVGYAYAGQHRARTAYRWSVDASAYVHSENRRHGIGRALYKSLLKILAAQGYFNAYAGITLPNAASVALHESVGFKAVGVYRNVGHKLGSWHDVGWWQRPLQPSLTAPTSPLNICEVERHESWAEMLAANLDGIRNTD